MPGERYFQELLAGGRQALPDRLLLSLLGLAAVPYGGLLRLRALAYERGLLQTRRLPRPVISVGNLTLGGTGKTPMVVWLARNLMERGKRVAVLSRGYGGSMEGKVALVSDGSRLLLGPAEAGDEPCLLAGQVPGLAVMIGASRYEAGLAALASINPDIFLLDDGFQHLALHRDLNLLLMDCHSPLGNGRTLPAGLLREPPEAMARAHMVVFTRCAGPATARSLLPTTMPFCRTRHRLTGFRELKGGRLVSAVELEGLRGMALAGIARPAGFFADLEELGLALVATHPLPDHCRFGAADQAAIVARYGTAGADYLVMTAKDAVKLAAAPSLPPRCLVAEMELVPEDDGVLRRMVENLL